MNRFIRYWNQNRFKIIITLIIVVFIWLLIYIINSILANVPQESINTNVTIQDSSKPTESVITGEEMPEETVNENTNLIQKFVSLCNQKNYNEAYNLLSTYCKEEVFPTIDDFKRDYVDKIFTSNKTYTLELWFDTNTVCTYRIIYIEDNILSSGKIDTMNNKEDYITVVKENNEKKLNLNGFITKGEIGNTSIQNNIEITVNNKLTYRSYEQYNITIKNNTNSTIRISDGQDGNEICLIDSNEVEYDSAINEISISDLIIEPDTTKNLSIKFYKIYNLYRTINKIRFKSINTDINNTIPNVISIDIKI